jgi:hypothetical protein
LLPNGSTIGVGPLVVDLICFDYITENHNITL